MNVSQSPTVPPSGQARATDPPVVTYDYLPFFYNGLSTEMIKKTLQEQSAQKGSIIKMQLLPKEEAYTKYVTTGMIPEDQFGFVYDAAFKSYDEYMKERNNYNLGQLFQYDPGTMRVRPDLGLAGNIDFSYDQGRYGFDEAGIRRITDAQIASERGLMEDQYGNIVKAPSMSYFAKQIRRFENTGKALGQWGASLFYSPEELEYADEYYKKHGNTIVDYLKPFAPATTITLGYDNNGTPIYKEMPADAYLADSRLIGVYGPEKLYASSLGNFALGFNNFFASLNSAMGTALSSADDMYDLLFNDGVDQVSAVERLGNVLQNYANEGKIRPSLYSQQGTMWNNRQMFMQQFGSLMAQLALMPVLSGLGTAMGMGVNAAQWSTFSVLGMASVDATAQAMKEMGINKVDAAWVPWVVGMIETGTEKFIGPNILATPTELIAMRAGLKTAVRKGLEKAAADAGLKSVKELGQANAKGVIGSIVRSLEKVFGNYRTGIGRMAGAFWEEGTEEGVSQLMQNMTQTVADFNALVKDPSLTPGQGLFGDMEKDTLFGNMMSRAPEGVFDAMVLGGLGGFMMGAGMMGIGPMQYGAKKWKEINRQKTIRDYVALGQTDKLIRIANEMHAKGAMDYSHLDGDGNVITADKEGQVLSMNDIAYQQIINEINMYDSIKQQYGLNDPELLKRYAGDAAFTSMAMEAAARLQQATREQNELNGIMPDQRTPEQIKRAEELPGIIEKAQADFNYVVNPEHDGARYSKAYNDRMKNAIGRAELARQAADFTLKNIRKVDITDEFRTTAPYLNAVGEILSRMPENIYDVVRNSNETFQTFFNTEWKDLINKSVESRPDFDRIMTDIETLIANPDIDFNTLGSELQKSLRELGNLDLFTRYDQPRLQRLQTLLSPDILKARLDPGYLQWQKDIEDAKTVEERQELEINPPQDKYFDIITIEDMLKGEFTGIYDRFNAAAEMNPDEVTPEAWNYFYAKSLRGLLHTIQTAKASNFQGVDPSVLLTQALDVGKQIDQNRQINNFNNKALRHVFADNANMKDHLVPQDMPIDDDTFTIVDRNMSELSQLLNADIKTLVQLSGEKGTHLQKVNSKRTEMDRLSLRIIFADKGLQVLFPEIWDKIQSLGEDNQDYYKENRTLTNTEVDTLIEKEKTIVEIMSMIYQNKEKILSDINIMDMLRKNWWRTTANMYSIIDDSHAYSRSNPKDPISLIDLFLITKDNFSDNKHGYSHFIQFLLTASGINMTDYYESLLKAEKYSDNGFIDVTASIEQQRSIATTVAFINTGSHILDIARNAEMEAWKEHYNYKEDSKEVIERKVRENKFRLNAITILGMWGSGKSQVVLPLSLIVHNLMNGSVKKAIHVVSISDFIEKQTRERIHNDIAKSITSQKVWDAIAEGIVSADIIVWDEASLLTPEAVGILKQKLAEKGRSNIPIIFLGDESQMRQLDHEDANLSFSIIGQLGYRAPFLSGIYSTGSTIISNLANYFSFFRIMQHTPQELPKAYMQEDTDHSNRQGVLYSANQKEVLDRFMESPNDSKALVFLDNNEYQAFEKQYKGNVALWNKLKNHLYILNVNIMVKADPALPQTIQGDRVDEVYIYTNLFNINDVYPNASKSHVSVAGYTAITRGRKFVNMIGYAAWESMHGGNTKNAADTAWSIAETTITDEQKSKLHNDYLNRINQILGKSKTDTNVSGVIVTPSPGKKTTTEKTVKTPSFTTKTNVIIKEGPQKGKRVQIFSILKSKSTDSDVLYNTYEVGDDGKINKNKKTEVWESNMQPVDTNTRDTVFDAQMNYENTDLFEYEDINMDRVYTKNGTDYSIYGFFRVTNANNNVSIMVQTDDGLMYSIEEFKKQFTERQLDTIDDVENNKVIVNRSADNYSNGKKIWGTVFTVFTDDAPTKAMQDTHRRINRVIANNLSLFDLELVYMQNVILLDRSNNPTPFNDVLAVRATFKSEHAKEIFTAVLEKSNFDDVLAVAEDLKKATLQNIPKSFPSYIASLADTEYDYGKTKEEGNKKIRDLELDYVKNITKIHNLIKNGFAGNNSEKDDIMRDLNKFLANLRYIGKHESQLKSQSRIPLGRIMSAGIKMNQGWVNIDQGQQPYETAQQAERRVVDNGMPMQQFIETMIAEVDSGIQFNEPSFTTHADGRFTAIINFAFGRTPTSSDPFVTLYMRQLKYFDDIDKTLSEWQDQDLDTLKNLNDNTTSEEFVKIILGLKIHHLLASNRSILIDNKKFNDVFKKYLFWENNRLRFVGKSFAQKLANVKTVWSLLLTDKVLMDLKETVRYPTGIAFPDKRVANEDKGLLYTNATNIHHPSAYFPLENIHDAFISSFPKVVTEENKPGTRGKPVNSNKDGKGHTKPIYQNKTITYASEQEVRDLVVHVFGKDFLENRTEFKTQLKVGDKEFFGYMYNGRMAFELSRLGIERTTPRHEIWHLVFNYMLSDTERNRIRQEAIKTMMTGKANPESISMDMVDEYLARKFGDRGITISNQVPWYMGNKYLWKLKTFMDKIFVRFQHNKSYIDAVMKKIDSGYYVREVEAMSPDAWKSRFVGNAKDEYSDDDRPVNQHDYYMMTDLFGSATYLNDLSKYIGLRIVDMSELSNYDHGSFSALTIGAAIRTLESEIIEEGIQAGEQDTKYGKIKELTPQHTIWLNDDEMFNYALYNLSRVTDYGIPYRAIVLNRYPGYDFDSGRFKKYNGDTITYDHTKINPDFTRSDFLHEQLELTPMRHFNNGILDDNGWDEKTYVNLSDLLRSLKIAAARARNIFMAKGSNVDGKNILEQFFSEVEKDARRISGNTRKADHLYSFLHKFNHTYDLTGSERGYYEMVVKHSEENNGHVPQRFINMEAFLNALVSDFISISQRHQATMTIRQTEAGKRYIYEREAYSVAEQLKNKIRDGIIQSTMDGTNGINERVREAFDGDYPQFMISATGLRWVQGISQTNLNKSSGTELIHVDDYGRITFATKDKEFIRNMASFLGLTSGKGAMKAETILLLFENDSEGLKERFQNILPVRASEISTQDILAQGMMNMFWAMRLNMNFVDHINKVDNAIAAEEIIPSQRTAEIEKFWNNPVNANMARIRDKVSDFAKAYGMSENTFDGHMASMVEDYNDVVLDDYVPKPADFYNFLLILGEAESYVRGDDSSDFSIQSDNTKRYNFVLSSALMDMLNDGSRYYLDKVLRIFNAHRVDEHVHNPFYDGNNFYNEIINPDSKMEVLDLWDYSGITASGMNGTTTPSVNDLNRMAFGAWLSDIKKGYYVETHNFLTTNLGDSGNNVMVRLTFDNSGKTKLVQHITFDKARNIVKVSINENMITNHIIKEFESTNRRFMISVSKWIDFLRSSGLTDIESAVNFGKFGTPGMSAEELSNFIVNSFEEFRIKALKDNKVMIQYNEALRLLKRDMLLRKDTDYMLKKNNDGTESVQAGKALLFNDPTYNQENYNNYIVSGNFTIEQRDSLFADEYFKFVRTMKATRYEPDEDVAKLSPSDTDPYYKYNRDTRTIDGYNPLFKAFFYGYHMANNQVMPLVMGHRTDTNSTAKNKYAKQSYTGVTKLVTNTRHGVADTMRVIMVEDLMIPTMVKKTLHRHSDGMSWGSGLMKLFMKHSFGGDYNNLEEGMFKPLTYYVDPMTGKMRLYKEAVDYISNDVYMNSIFHRQLQHAMLRHTDDILKQTLGDVYDVSIEEKFFELMKHYAGNTRPFEKAMYELYRWICEDTRHRDAIKNALVWKVANESTSKMMNSGVNTWDPLNSDIPTDLVSHSIESSSVGMVLNPHQDIEEIDRLTPFNQILAYLGFGRDINRQKATKIYENISRIMQIGREIVDKKIEDTSISEDVANDDERYIAKLRVYIRNLGIRQVRSMGFVGNYAKVMFDMNVSSNLSFLRNKLIPIYNKLITKEIFKVSMTGIRMNQASAEPFRVFIKDGIEYMLSEVEKKLGREIIWQEVASGKVEDYKVARLSAMLPGEEQNSVYGFLMPFSYMKPFRLRQHETLNDAFTLHFTDSKREAVNTRNMTADQLEAFILDEIKKGGLQTFNVDKSPMLRHKEGHLKFFTALQKTLEIYASRVPANRLASGGPGYIVGFINDNANTIYTPLEMQILNDSDNDIDQLSVYLQSINNNLSIKTGGIGGLQNEILDIIKSIYQDPENAENIIIPSNLENLQKLADTSSSTNEYVSDNMYSTTLSDYHINKSGADSVGIFANSISGFGYLNYIGDDLIRMAPAFEGIITYRRKGSESIMIRIGDFLQAALDNAKLLILGNLGISSHAINVVAVMCMDGKSNEEIRDFFEQELIQQIYRQVEIGDDVLESSFTNRPLPIIQEFIDKRIDSAKLDSKTKKSLEVERERLKTENDTYIEVNPEWNKDPLMTNAVAMRNERISIINDLLQGVEDLKILAILQDYAIRAEAVRRMATIVALRNGLPPSEFQFDNMIHDMSTAFGMDVLSIDRDGAELIYDINRHMNYYIYNDNNYKTEKDVKKKAKLYDTEKRVAEAIHIPDIIAAIPWTNEMVGQISQLANENKKLWLNKTDYFDEMAYDYLDGQSLAHWDYYSRYRGYSDAVDEYILDFFFKDKYFNTSIDIRVPKFNPTTGIWYKDDSTIKTLMRLDTSEGRKLFLKYFIPYFSFINTLANTDSFDEAKNMISSFLGQPYSESNHEKFKSLHELFRTNQFIHRLYSQGRPGAEMIAIKDYYSLDDGKIDFLHREFEKLPYDIKQTFKLYQIIGYKFGFMRGHLGDVIGSDIYQQVSASLGKLKNIVESPSRGDDKALQKASENFHRFLGHVNGLSSYLSRKKADSGLFPETILRRIKLREGLYITVVARYNPAHTDYEGNPDTNKNGYYLEYLTVDGRGLTFDLEHDITTSAESIRNLTADDYDKLFDKSSNGQLTKPYYRGHNYQKLKVYNVVVENEFGTDENMRQKVVTSTRYYLSNGLVLKVVNSDFTSATFILANESIESLTAKQLDFIARYKQEEDNRLIVRMQQKNAGLQDIITSMENFGDVSIAQDFHDNLVSIRGMMLPLAIIEGKMSSDIAKKYNLDVLKVAADEKVKSGFVADENGNIEYIEKVKGRKIIIPAADGNLEEVEIFENVEKQSGISATQALYNRLVKQLGQYYNQIHRENILKAGGVVLFGDNMDISQKNVLKWAHVFNKPVFVYNGDPNQLRLFIARNNIKSLYVSMSSEKYQKGIIKSVRTAIKKGVFDNFTSDTVIVNNDTGEAITLRDVKGTNHPVSLMTAITEDTKAKDVRGHYKGRMPGDIAWNSNINAKQQQDTIHAVIEKIKDGVDGIPVQEIYDIPENHVNDHGWVKDGTVYINMNKVSLAAPFHEFFHLWVAAIKGSDTDAYNEIRIMAREWMRNNPEFMATLSNNYPELGKYIDADVSGDDYVDEVIAQLGGMASIPLVQKWLMKHGYKEAIERPGIAHRLWNSIQGILNRLYNAVNSMFRQVFGLSDMELSPETDRLSDILYKVVEGILDGKITYNFNDPVIANAIASYYHTGTPSNMEALERHFIATNNHGGINDMKRISRMRDMSDFKRVSNIKDFHYVLASNTGTLKNFDASVTDEETLTDFYMGQIRGNIVNDKKTGKQYYSYTTADGENYRFDTSLTYDQLRSVVKEKIVHNLNKYEKLLGHNIIEIARRYMNGEDLAEITRDIFGYAFNPGTIEKLMKFMGINDNVVSIMQYSDLQLHKKYKKFYSPSFEGYNPIVVVHNVGGKDDIFDISIIDLTTLPIMLRETDLDMKGLISTYQNDRKYNEACKAKGIDSMSNMDYDIRRVMLMMTLMKMRSMGNVRVRNLGVVQLTKTQPVSKMIVNINGVLGNIALMSDNKDLMGLIDNDEIRSVLSNKALYGLTYEQSYISRVRQMIDEWDDDEWHLQHMDDIKEVLLGKNMSRPEMLRALRLLQNDLRGRFSDNAERNSFEYQITAMAIMQLETGRVGWINSIRDLHKWLNKILTAHNIDNDAAQYLIGVYNRSRSKVVEMMNNFLKKMEPYEKGIIKEYLQAGTGTQLGSSDFYLSRVYELGSKYYKNMWKTVKAVANRDYPEFKIKKGDMVDVVIPVVHWNKDDTDTRELLKSGKITQEHLDLYNSMYDEWTEAWAQEIYHTQLRRGNKDYTMDMARQSFKDQFPRGTVPVVSKGVGEMFWKGSWTGVKEATQKRFRQVGEYSRIFEDRMEDENETGRISTQFTSQFRMSNRHTEAGVALRGDGQWEILDMHRNMNVSTNLENLGNYFQFAALRKFVYEEETIPAINDFYAVINMLEGVLPGTDNLESLKQWAKWYTDRNIYRRTQDPTKHDNITIPGIGTFNITGVVRAALMLNSTLNLALSIPVAFKSLVYNLNRITMTTLSATMAQWGTENSEDILPTIGDVIRALKLIFTDFRKTRALAYKFQIINSSERDMIDNIMVNPGKKSWFSPVSAHFLAWGTDAGVRAAGMVAMMIKHGSWDAYTYNKKTGEVEYDITKDDMYYTTENGKRVIKDGDQGKFRVEALKERLIGDGVMTNENDAIDRGYDYALATSILKWFGDKFLVGSMDEQSKAVIGQTWLGGSFSQFRVFSWDRWFNIGVGAYTRKTQFGTQYEEFKDDNGEWVSRKQISEQEGMWQSVSAGIYALMNRKNMPVKQWWAEQSHIRRANIYMGPLQLLAFISLYAVVSGFLHPDKQPGETDEEYADRQNRVRRYAWLFDDLMFVRNARDLAEQPFAISDSILDIYDTVMGQEDFSKLKRFTGPYAATERTIRAFQ